MEALPQYEQDCQVPQSPFQQKLLEMGYCTWHRFPSAQPNAFYTLISTGILYHYYMNYPISEHLQIHYRGTLPTLMSADQEAKVVDRWTNLTYWNSIGPALITDFLRKFQGKSSAPTVRAGKMPDKNVSSLFETLMSTCKGILVWYEQRETEVVCHVWSESGRNPAIYLCGGEENGWYYLLIHRSFLQGAEREGFPYFTTNSTSREGIPQPFPEQIPEQLRAPEVPPNPAGTLEFIRAINERMTTIERKCDTLSVRLDSLEKRVVQKLDDILERLPSS